MGRFSGVGNGRDYAVASSFTLGAVLVFTFLALPFPHSALRYIPLSFAGLALVAYIFISVERAKCTGVIFPTVLRRFKSDGIHDVHAVAVASVWTSHKRLFDYFVDKGIEMDDAFLWICACTQLRFTRSEITIVKSAVVEIDAAGMTPDRFVSFYLAGIEKKDDFITIAENDLDMNIVMEVFPLVHQQERRIARINSAYKPLGILV
jgi:hypothetical protein